MCDLVDAAPQLEAALSITAQACQQRLTTAARLCTELGDRVETHRRGFVLAALDDIASGAHSFLELEYLRRVERAHGLPAGRRQHQVMRGRRTEFHDVSYDEYGVVSELDGRLGHDSFADRHRDMRRDNRNAGQRLTVLRFGLADVGSRACEAAGQVGQALRRGGWPGRPRSCGSSCAL